MGRVGRGGGGGPRRRGRGGRRRCRPPWRQPPWAGWEGGGGAGLVGAVAEGVDGADHHGDKEQPRDRAPYDPEPCPRRASLGRTQTPPCRLNLRGASVSAASRLAAPPQASAQGPKVARPPPPTSPARGNADRGAAGRGGAGARGRVWVRRVGPGKGVGERGTDAAGAGGEDVLAEVLPACVRVCVKTHICVCICRRRCPCRSPARVRVCVCVKTHICVCICVRGCPCRSPAAERDQRSKRRLECGPGPCI